MNERFLLRNTLGDLAVSENKKPEIEKPKGGDIKSLRDDFAMAALDHATSVYTKMSMAEIDRLMNRKNYSKDEAIARLAYNMADAMLAAREI